MDVTSIVAVAVAGLGVLVNSVARGVQSHRRTERVTPGDDLDDPSDAAARWLERLERTSDMLRIGGRHEEYHEMPKAEEWYRKAADLGDPAAMMRLGSLLERRGAFQEAAEWFDRSERQSRALWESWRSRAEILWRRAHEREVKDEQ